MPCRSTNAASLRQVCLGLRVGAIEHDEAASILEALLDSYELHDKTNKLRERRAREEYEATIQDDTRRKYEASLRKTKLFDDLAAAAEREAAEYAAFEESLNAQYVMVDA